MSHRLSAVAIALLALILSGPPLRGRADWPMLHGNARHDGYSPLPLPKTWRLAWVREFPNERLGTAMEAIVDNQGVYLATHQGNVHALNPRSGTLRWTFRTHAPCLHSPALHAHLLVVANAHGTLYGLDTDSGTLRWRQHPGHAGYSASPVLGPTLGFIGDRSGLFTAFHLQDGSVAWSTNFAVPIRQTAALDGQHLYITTEDLRVRCLEAETGAPRWTSAPLAGQTARDYYPVVCSVADHTYVIVRTNPSHNMARRIATDRTRLAQHANADDSNWKALDQWIKSDASRGTPDRWTTEQDLIRTLLEQNPGERTFVVLEASTGLQTFTAPIFWVGGCQGVGIMPARTHDQKLLVLHRTAYGNWNHGIAPLVGLGTLDLTTGHLTPLFHSSGDRPPWNTFWGTADESQNLVIAGQTALLVHQGTLSGLDLQSHELFPIAGNRDTFGGFPGTLWARNEWHGPARGGVAVTSNGLFWLTGSRVLALQPGTATESIPIATNSTPSHPILQDPSPDPPDWPKTFQDLETVVGEVLSRTWAPLSVEPGLAGRQAFFTHSGETFEALAWAYPLLPRHLQERVQHYLARTWETHRPFTTACHYPLAQGTPREWADVPPTLRTLPKPVSFHPFGNLYTAWLYARRCNEHDRVLASWPEIEQSYRQFSQLAWQLNPLQGDRWANRYTASLLAMAEIATHCGQPEIARQCESQADRAILALVQWWQRAAQELDNPTAIRTVADLDPFIGQGGAFSLRLAPHHHKIGLFQDLTPEVADRLLRHPDMPELVTRVDLRFQQVQPTWWLVGEERQVHSGENYLDTPDHAYQAFRSLVFLRRLKSPALQLATSDLPFCRADLYYLTKLAIAVESHRKTSGDPPFP